MARIFGGVAAGALVGFAMVATASASRRTSRVDRAVERRAHVPRKKRAGRAARGMAPVNKTYTLLPLAAAASAYVLSRSGEGAGVARRSRSAGAVAIAVSGLAGALAEPAFDRWLPQPPVPGGHTRKQPVLPSGHTFKPAALALTCAHVFSREGLAPGVPAYAMAAALPLASGAAKIVSRKHWLSDVAAGVLAGVAIGSACCAAYELTRRGQFSGMVPVLEELGEGVSGWA